MHPLLRIAARAVDPRLTALVRDERGHRAALSAPLPRGVSIAVVGMPSGVGASTTAALVALALAEHRDEHVLAVDADPAGGLGAQLGPPPPSAELLARIGVRKSTVDALPVGSRWVRQRLATTAGPGLLADGLTAAEYAAAVGRLRRWYPVLVTDASSTRHAPALPGVLRAADRLVVVGGADAWGIDLVRRGLRRLSALVPLEYAVCALVCGSPGVRLSDRDASAELGLPARVIPHDPAVATRPLELAALAPRTRVAIFALAAAAMRAPAAEDVA